MFRPPPEPYNRKLQTLQPKDETPNLAGPCAKEYNATKKPVVVVDDDDSEEEEAGAGSDSD
jgi:hypothetical protein